MLDRAVLRRQAGLRALAPLALPAVAAVAFGVLAWQTRVPGHDWGDDFSLYIRQARSIARGNVHAVLDDTRFAVDHSSWHTFSPYAYPWGYPLMLLPVYAVFGTDYEAFKAIGLVSFVGFLFCFHRLLRPRLGEWGALALVSLFGLSWSYATWVNQVLSDLPYLFLVFLALWLMDRGRRHDWWEGSLARLVPIGLLLALAFNVRREGAALVVALMAVHLGHLRGRRTALRAAPSAPGGRVAWLRLLAPYVTFAAAVALLQLALPSVLVPSYPGAGLANVHDRLNWYRDIFAEQIGLKHPGSARISIGGNVAYGYIALTLVAVLAVIGLVARLARHLRTDAHLAVYLGVAGYGVLTQPFQEGRYLYALTPLVIYFAVQAVPEVAAALNRPAARQAAVTSALIGVMGLAVLNGWKLKDYAHDASTVRSRGYVQWGPQDPLAVDMAGAVRRYTAPDDVVAFFRSRAMMLLTDRRSIQSGGIDGIRAEADWFVMEDGPNGQPCVAYSQPCIAADAGAQVGMTMVWRNAKFVLWKVERTTG